MAFELDISQAERGVIRIADFADLADAPIRDALVELADRLRGEIAAELAQGGTGRLYRRGLQRFRGSVAQNIRGGVAQAFHRASAPGRPPASDSGKFLGSLRTRIGTRKLQARAAVLGPVFYGFMLESGTLGILPRPSFVPAAQRLAGEFVSRIEAALDKAAESASLA